ncbi:MAG TPA: lysophospholipid acyltransferase family protein [Acidimicrobiales bacterium]|nr:lysophospholipid acyltransferase family protein [Acidimicrobiales bacterium]
MPEHDQREYGQLYTVAKRVLTPLFRFGWRVKVSGLENVPEHGPAILCPNHTSVIDSFMMPLVLPRRITFVGKAEYMDDWKTKFIFPAMGMIPIDRGGGKAAVRALNTAARVLERGELFGIYPEGTRSRDGRLHKGHTGAARLSLRTRAPIIPVGMRGTRDIQPPDAKFPKPFKVCSVAFGTPVEPDRYSDREDRLVLRQMIDEVMFSIRELSGQEYIDAYATKKAEGLPTEVVHIAAPPAPRRSSADVLNAAGAIAAAQ